MSITRILIVSAAMAFAVPAGAQRGARPPREQTQPPANQRTDTSTVKRTPAGFVLDFQDQQLRTVLSALSEAAALNVSLSNIQDQRVTLRMGQPVTREGMVEVLRQVSEQYGLKMRESGTLIRIEGAPPVRTTPGPSLAQQLQQQQQQVQQRIYTYRLKHAVAEQIAPVLSNLFSGAQTGFNTGRGGNVQITGPGGLQIFTPQGPGQGVPVAGVGQVNPNANPGRGGNAGGRGGDAGG